MLASGLCFVLVAVALCLACSCTALLVSFSSSIVIRVVSLQKIRLLTLS